MGLLLLLFMDQPTMLLYMVTQLHTTQPQFTINQPQFTTQPQFTINQLLTMPQLFTNPLSTQPQLTTSQLHIAQSQLMMDQLSINMVMLSLMIIHDLPLLLMKIVMVMPPMVNTV